jgi:hypothetical protein
MLYTQTYIERLIGRHQEVVAMSPQSPTPRRAIIGTQSNTPRVRIGKDDHKRSLVYREQWMRLPRDYFSPYACRR